MSKEKMSICQECKAILKSPNEFHPYEYCLLAKAEPEHWRRAVKYIIDNGNKYGKSIIKNETSHNISYA